MNKKQGYVVAAHCTCKAGLGEACSHIAALLFKVEAVDRFGLNQETKTSVACAWNKSYPKKVTAQRIVDIDFTTPKYGKTAKWKVNKQRRVEVAGLDESEQHRALEALRRICPTAGCLTKAKSDTDSASEDEDLPPLLSRFRETEGKDCSADDLRTQCADFLKDFIVSQHQCDNLEKMTRTQSHGHDSTRHQYVAGHNITRNIV
ncbi:uncharacterized protein LOC110367812 [Fundulus heteroclitus]|uniref:uncharacterized protein LOC110367812 n=1 Tax=Fundulus heteroclitus TaxID=8078 RepID=UPI00165AA944|nr:uncharacterized protein LOC110367812 [Fundulus heteroclitus]